MNNRHSLLKNYALVSASLNKQAEDNAVISFIKNSFKEHFDQENPAKSVVNFLSPGIVGMALKGMGFGWIGAAISLALSVFHIDFYDALKNIASKISNVIAGNKPISSDTIDSFVDQEIPDQEIKSSSIELRRIKLAGFGASSAIPVIKALLAIIAKTVVASAGLMLAGDAINKVVPKIAPSLSLPSTPSEVYIAFKSKSNPPDPEVLQVKDKTPQSISQSLIDLTNQIYDVSNLSSAIQNLPKFKNLISEIIELNRFGDPDAKWVGLPGKYKTAKDMVNSFLVDLKP